MFRHLSFICKIASVQVFIEGSNDKVLIPEIDFSNLPMCAYAVPVYICALPTDFE